MESKFATSILFAAFILPVMMPITANAAKLPPLATMKLGDNQTTYIFDPNKVTAVALTYGLTVTLKPVRANSEVNQGPLKPHVWGIAEIPLSINESPENFLKELQLETRFITLHSLSGELHLRASRIKYIIEPPLQVDRERGAKALVYLGPGMVDWSGVPRPWLVTETPGQVKALADEKRAQEDGELEARIFGPPEQRVPRGPDTICRPARQSSRHWRSADGSDKWRPRRALPKSARLRSRSSAG